MASPSTPDTDRTEAARRRLTEKMLRLDAAIDREPPGSPQRLKLLREQANLGDAREALRSTRL